MKFKHKLISVAPSSVFTFVVIHFL